MSSKRIHAESAASKISRRRILTFLSALPFASHTWAQSVGAAPAQKLLVMVYLKGGNDAYNTLVPFANARYRSLRPTLRIDRDQVTKLSESHGLHSALSAVMPMWNAGELALIQGIGQQEITNQHYRDMEMQFTGAGPDQYLTEGWVTRAMQRNAAPNPDQKSTLDALAFGDLDIREADPMGPFRGNQLRVVNVQHPVEWLAKHSIDGTKHWSNVPARNLGFSQAAPAPLRTSFPNEEFGLALKSAVELAAVGMAPPVIHITVNANDGDQHHAFDTHWNQLDFHAKTLDRLAHGLAAFRDGMREIGQWDNTLLLTYDEFGRSPKENDDKGTHHGWSSVQFAMGGRVKGGLIGEPVPVVDVFSIDGPPPTIDYRSLYTTVIEQWWGGSASRVFERNFKSLPLLRA